MPRGIPPVAFDVKNPTNLLHNRPRMSWSMRNLFNLYQQTFDRTTKSDTKFDAKFMRLPKQQWKAKQLLRAYHGDWIQEKRFKNHYVPAQLPPMRSTPGKPVIPLTSLMFSEVEKRIDVVVFRCCFACSIYAARQMVLKGFVKLNGLRCTNPNLKLSPGDLISVKPSILSIVKSARQKEKEREAATAVKTEDVGENEMKEDVMTSEENPETQENPDTQGKEGMQEKEDAEGIQAKEETEETEEKEIDRRKAQAEVKSASSDQTEPSPSTSKTEEPLAFHLPDYAAPFLFIPAYIEPSFQTCSAVYLRHPTADHGYSEVPSPYPADGQLMKLAWEYYMGMKRTKPRLKGLRIGS